MANPPCQTQLGMLPQDGSTRLYWLKWLIKHCMASVQLNVIRNKRDFQWWYMTTSYHSLPEAMTDCLCGTMQRKIKSLMMIKIYCSWVCTSTTDRTECKYNFGDVMGWWNSKRIKQQWSDSGHRLSVTPRMRDPECCRDCKHCCDRGTTMI